eukprot:g19107.t1
MRLQVAWTAGDPGDCRFQAWEVYLQLQDLDDTFCHVDHLWSGRSYDLQLRQVCSDPASSVVHALTGGQCTVTAVAASAPVNLTAHSVGPYELQVSWAAQHPWACTFYSWQARVGRGSRGSWGIRRCGPRAFVQVKPQASDQWASGLGCESLDRDVANCTVDVGLGSNTPYDVRVRESCVEAALNSTWLQLAFPGVSTPWPVKADGPSLLQVTQISAFELRITWLPGPFSNDCTFSAWDVELILADGSTEEQRNDGILQLAASAAPIEALETCAAELCVASPASSAAMHWLKSSAERTEDFGAGRPNGGALEVSDEVVRSYSHEAEQLQRLEKRVKALEALLRRRVEKRTGNSACDDFHVDHGDVLLLQAMPSRGPIPKVASSPPAGQAESLRDWVTGSLDALRRSVQEELGDFRTRIEERNEWT